MTFYLTLLSGIVLGLALAGWIMSWKEIQAMMIHYIFSLRNHLRMKWFKFRLGYLKVLRRLI